MRGRAILGAAVASLAFAACFESFHDLGCPAGLPVSQEGYCFASAPDGFNAPDGPPCSSSSDCDPATPICASHICQRCAAPADDAECAARNPATPRCDAAGGTCVRCTPATQVTDCAGLTPSCGSDQTCRACQTNKECASGICAPDGHCIPSNDIAYVDNGGVPPATCKPGTHDGTSAATAFCDIQDAVSGTKPYVLVKGSTAAYGAININNRNITLVGPGFAAAPTAHIQGIETHGVEVQESSTAVVDGFEVTTSTSSGKHLDGIRCESFATTSMTARRNHVHDNSATGISSACNAVVDANLVGPKNAYGLTLDGTNGYKATNNLIFRNQQIGVIISGYPSGEFQFNTVAGNGGGGATFTGGIDCGTYLTKIERSIVASNVMGGTPASQLRGQCMLVDVVVGTAEMGPTGGTQLDPDFVNINPLVAPYDYRLKAPNNTANLACCVDKIFPDDAGASTLPNHDIDFTMRPLGPAWDIGAHEAQ